MDDNLTNAINQLQNMLSSDEGKKNIENMLGSLGSVSAPQNGSDTGIQNLSGLLNPDNISKVKNIMDTFQRHDDPRSQLLLSLKPYLSPIRSSKIDTAVMLLSLGKIPSIVKLMRG